MRFRPLAAEMLEERRLLSLPAPQIEFFDASPPLCVADQGQPLGAAAATPGPGNSPAALPATAGTQSEQFSIHPDGANQAPTLTPAWPMKTTVPQTALVFTLSSFINNGSGTTTIQDADAGDPVGGIAVIGATGRGTWAYSLSGSSFLNISAAPAANSAILVPAGASLRYTPDGVDPEIAALTFRAWDATSGNPGDTGVDTTSNGGSSAFSTSTDILAVSVRKTLTPAMPANLGVFNGGYWYRDMNGNATLDSGDGGPLAFNYSGAVPVTGDWNGDGRTDIGLFENGQWWLDTNEDGVLDSGDAMFSFGFAGSNVLPVVGDWNGAGKTEVGVYCNGAWFRDVNGSHTWDATNQAALAYLGWAADTQTVIPVPGDWNGDGKTEMGVYSKGVWFRDTTGSGKWDGSFAYWGWDAQLTPVAGDWNGDGKDEFGVYNQGVWFRDADASHTWDAANQQALAYFGWAGAVPVVGNWNGNEFAFMGSSPAPADVSYTDKSGTATEVYAYPGQVQVFVSPQTTAAQFAGFAEASGGTVLGQDPAQGYYLVGVFPGSESAFITAAYTYANASLAVPNEDAGTATAVNLGDLWTSAGVFPGVGLNTGRTAAQTGTNTFDYIIDDNVHVMGGTSLTHEAAVTYCETQPTRQPNQALGLNTTPGAGLQINVATAQSAGLSLDANLSALQIAVQNLQANPSDRAVINLSQGAGNQKEDGTNKTQAEYSHDEYAFLALWAPRLAQIGMNDPTVLSRIDLVVAAGNGYIGGDGLSHGIDLGPFLTGLHTQFPTVFPADGGHHMIVVGATESDGTTVHTAYNYVSSNYEQDASGNPTMVYAPGVGVQIAANGTTGSGTSFAAPVVKALLDRALAARPTAALAERRPSLLRRLPATGHACPAHTGPGPLGVRPADFHGFPQPRHGQRELAQHGSHRHAFVPRVQPRGHAHLFGERRHRGGRQGLRESRCGTAQLPPQHHDRHDPPGELHPQRLGHLRTQQHFLLPLHVARAVGHRQSRCPGDNPRERPVAQPHRGQRLGHRARQRRHDGHLHRQLVVRLSRRQPARDVLLLHPGRLGGGGGGLHGHHDAAINVDPRWQHPGDHHRPYPA